MDMEILNIEGTAGTPKIILDKKNGIFEISGRSLPDDAHAFYKTVLEWVVNYAKDPNVLTAFTFKLDYFNTASAKLILDLLSALEYVPNTKITWSYREENKDMEDAGDEFSELVTLPFEFKPY